MARHEPEVTRAKARKYVANRNREVHEAPWTKGKTGTSSGISIALKLADGAYRVHGLPYETGLSKFHLYDPRRFTWIYDPNGAVWDYVKLRDNQTGRVVVWPWLFGAD